MSLREQPLRRAATSILPGLALLLFYLTQTAATKVVNVYNDFDAKKLATVVAEEIKSDKHRVDKVDTKICLKSTDFAMRKSVLFIDYDDLEITNSSTPGKA